MVMTRELMTGIIGGIIAILLQILLAPLIPVASIVPNFIVAFCVARAIATCHNVGYLAPFVCGLLFDLIGGGPVGAMAFVLVLVTLLSSRIFALFDNDTLFMSLAIVLFSVLFVELVYGSLLVLCGTGISWGEAFIYRVLPCTLYDGIIALVFYPIAMKLMVDRPLKQPGMPVLR